MDVSYKWLAEEYFNGTLPDPRELVTRITKGAFEIEQVTPQGDDYLIDVDVLPNRAHDCLCHRGIAREIGVLTNTPVTEKVYEPVPGDETLREKLSVTIENEALCPRYIGRYMANVTVGPSPDWLRERVESLGQRSINNIVDITNYVLFGMGQPLHVFDADKIEDGEIRIRSARAGETITTLDNREIELDETVLVIADGKDPIALAGIKGGKKAEVDEHTTNIVIESANFNSVLVRKIVQKTQIKTDASKRYENGITSEMAAHGIEMATALIQALAGTDDTVVAPCTDVYPHSETQATITVSYAKINQVIGIEVPCDEVIRIIEAFGFPYDATDTDVTITVPHERLDMRIAEDLIEEIARIYGYDKVPEELPSAMDFAPTVLKEFYYRNKIRQVLNDYGYSEVQTYVLRATGALVLENPLAKDRPYLRDNIHDGITDSLILNARNLDLLGADTVNIFEFGAIFTPEREYTALGIGYHNPKRKKSKAGEQAALEAVLKKLSEDLGIEVPGDIVDRHEGGATVQIDFTALIEVLPQPDTYDTVLETGAPECTFAPISPYPHMSRDIAVFVPSEADQTALEHILTKAGGDLLVRAPRLFDVFTKENEDGTSQVSYAYKLVFQSDERTLTDEEVNEIMETVNAAVIAQGWTVR
ncbi:MAG: phenylalanine--tRNA ligase subunit beta [Candidatus Pacebacteria bacterium]|nr:phenylalanine--tRNA ligase subunit beta [Candidatus Paceibacterota bacterium]